MEKQTTFLLKILVTASLVLNFTMPLSFGIEPDPLPYAFAFYRQARFFDGVKLLESSSFGPEKEAIKEEDEVKGVVPFLPADRYFSLIDQNPWVNSQLALNHYQDAVRTYPTSPLVPRAVSRMSEIQHKKKVHQPDEPEITATSTVSEKRRVLIDEADPLSLAFDLYRKARFFDAVRLLKSILSGPDKEKVEVEEEIKEVARFLLADCYFNLMDRNPSIHSQLSLGNYQDAVRSYPKSLLVPRATFRMAEIYNQKKVFQKATYLYKKIISKYGGSPYAARSMFALGKILVAKGNDASGLKMVKQAVAEYPESILAAEGRIFLVGYYAEKEDYLAALSEYEKIPLVIVSSRPDLKNMQSEILFELGRYEKARKFLFKWVNLYPKDPSASKWMALIGDTYLAEESVKDAQKIYYQTKTRYPKSEGGVMAQAAILDIRARKTQKGTFEKVVKGYDRLIKATAKKPYAPLAVMRKAHMFYLTGHMMESITLFRRFLVDYPESPYRKKGVGIFLKALNIQVRTSYQEKKYLDVVELVQKNSTYLLGTDVDSETAWRIAESHRQASFLHTAAGMMERLREKEKRFQDNDTFLYRLGELYLDLGETGKALKILKGLIDRFPEGMHRGDAYALLGRAAYQAGEYDRAVRYARLSLIGRTPEHMIEVYYTLGSSYWMQGERWQALEAFRSALKIEDVPDESGQGETVRRTVSFAVGDILYDLQRYKEALKAYKGAAADFPKDRNAAWAWYRIGLIQMEMGKEETALKTFKGIERTEREYPLGLLIQDALKEISWREAYLK